MIVLYKVSSGVGEIDTAFLTIGTDGKMQHRGVPLLEEQIAALRERFGGALDLALDAAKALS